MLNDWADRDPAPLFDRRFWIGAKIMLLIVTSGLW